MYVCMYVCMYVSGITLMYLVDSYRLFIDSTNSILFILCLLFVDNTSTIENNDPRDVIGILFLDIVILFTAIGKKT